MKNFKNIKGLGLGVVAFEATEHLVNIISEIRDLVDYVVIGLQKVSYHGDPISEVDYQEVLRLRDEDHLVDEIIELDLDTTKKAREQETDKRNLLIDSIKEHNCSHALIIDSDEYYVHKSFKRALEEIDENDYPITYCQYINYWYDYEHYLVYPFKNGMFVPFVTRVDYKFNFECRDFDRPSDPTRRYEIPGHIETFTSDDGKVSKRKVLDVGFYIFPWETIKMHHLSWVRKNIRKKLNVWSSKLLFKNYRDLIDSATDVHDNYVDGEITSAKLLFNTADNKVDIVKFPRQYIHPKFDINTRQREAYQAKNIVFLCLSSSKKPFIDYEKAILDTYAKDIVDSKYPNMKFYFYRHKDGITAPEIDEENHIIWTSETDELGIKCFLKFKEAVSALKDAGITYDYLVRPNSSTWVNVKALDLFLGYLDNDKTCYSGSLYSAWWTFHALYLAGTSMILPSDEVEYCLDPEYDMSTLPAAAADDTIISTIISQRYRKLNVKYYQHFKSLGIYFDKNKEYLDTVKTPELFDRYMFFQTKIIYENGEPLKGNRNDSVDVINNKYRGAEEQRMYSLNESFEKYISDKDDSWFKNVRDTVVENIDKDVYMLNCSKKDDLNGEYDSTCWQYLDKNKCGKQYIIDNESRLRKHDIENRS